MDHLAKLAVAMGELVTIDGKIFLHATQEERLRTEVAQWIRQHGPATVSEIREAIGSTRKYVVPFMEYLDRQGFTQRAGDQRTLTESADEQYRQETQS